MSYVAIVLAALAVLFIVQLIHLSWVTTWSARLSAGNNYYALSAGKRRRFRGWLRLHAVLLWPILKFLSAISRHDFSQRCFIYQETAGPSGACSAEAFHRASEYKPQPEDVFVVTQMRSGTTWMQHLVYQVLMRGQGDLVAEGTALNAVSPWIEGEMTVAMDQAPLVGDTEGRRIVKTHLPATLCPYHERAKYIYVARHPVSCFASCIDFVRNNARGFAPDMDDFERWFMSPQLMWWSTWPEHVGHWQELASRHDNILFVRFEEMKRDLGKVAMRVAEFLEVPHLTHDEMESVLHKCSFAYMREHADTFEMHPPHLLQVAGGFFVSGQEQRSQNVPADVRKRIRQWCQDVVAEKYPVIGELYPDLAEHEGLVHTA